MTVSYPFLVRKTPHHHRRQHQYQRMLHINRDIRSFLHIGPLGFMPATEGEAHIICVGKIEEDFEYGKLY